MKNKVLNSIIKYNLINGSSKVLVGVSGGADSVALLNVLNELQTEIPFKILAVHINHNIRGAEALRDQKFVEDLCNKKNVELVVKNIFAKELAVKHKKTLEQVARDYRYKEFQKIADEMGCTEIAVAHNSDDQAETILMHLARGAGLNGLCGMSYKANNIIRPLLGVSRKEIEEYNKSKNLLFVTDSTNCENEYTRNGLRNIVLPELEKFYPAAKQNICAVGEKLKEIAELVNSKIRFDLIISQKNGDVLVENSIKDLMVEEQKLLIMEAFKRINHGVDIEEKHINQTIKLLSQQVGKKNNMPNQIVVIRTRDGLAFFKEKKDKECTPILFDPKSTRIMSSLGQIKLTIKNKDKIIGDGLYVDLAKIPRDAVWRSPKAGDCFQKFGGGTKSLASYLTDKKIELKQKREMVVLALDNEVLIIPGIEISDKLKIDEKTQKVVEICLKR